MEVRQRVALGVMLLLSIVVVSSLTSAVASNESVAAAGIMARAEVCFNDMVKLGLPVQRANTSLQEALQLYAVPIAKEAKGGVGNFNYSNAAALTICDIKAVAIKASEEYLVFNDSYNDATRTNNLSEMDAVYNSIVLSYTEERFEDTIKLVNQGYLSISDIQSKQTALKLFYDSTSRSLKKFVSDNWKSISTTTIIIVVLLLVFWGTIKRFYFVAKMRHLRAQKESISRLIKGLQREYFQYQKISDTEFSVKMNRFKEMTLDIDRQVPMIEEELAKLSVRKGIMGLFGKKKEITPWKEKYEIKTREVVVDHDKNAGVIAKPQTKPLSSKLRKIFFHAKRDGHITRETNRAIKKAVKSAKHAKRGKNLPSKRNKKGKR